LRTTSAGQEATPDSASEHSKCAVTFEAYPPAASGGRSNIPVLVCSVLSIATSTNMVGLRLPRLPTALKVTVVTPCVLILYAVLAEAAVLVAPYIRDVMAWMVSPVPERATCTSVL